MLTTTDSIGKDTETILTSLECAITSHAVRRLSVDEVNVLRKNSKALPGNIASAVLRHCEEQTLAGLSAIQDAIERFETQPTSWENWGVVFSSRYLGRSAFAHSLGKFAVEGPWNVSIQVVPHRSLHSPASMVGLTLGCHAPCVGVGGGLDGESDAWLTAVSLLEQHSLDGIWLVFSGWDPEVQIDLEGTWLGETRCTALAMALQPDSSEKKSLRLRVVHDTQAPEQLEIPAKSTAIELFERFVASGRQNGAMSAMLGGGLRAEIDLPEVVSHSMPLPPQYTSIQKKAA